MVLISGSKLSNWLQPQMQTLHDHCGIILAINERGTAFKRATVTFVKIQNIYGLITAYHVYESLINEKVILYCNLNEQNINLPEPKKYNKKLDYVWVPLDTFDELETDKIKYFDTHYSDELIKLIDKIYLGINPEEAAREPSFFLINGSPNFASSYNKYTNEQDISLQAMHIQFRQITTRYEEASRLSFEFDANELRIDDKEKENKFRKKFIDGLKSSNNTLMGGFSGGPICVFGYDGLFLIGITIECKNFDSRFNIIAAPINEIISNIIS